MKHRVFLIAALFCLALGGVCSCSQEDAASSSAPVQSATRPDINDPEQRKELVKELVRYFYHLSSIDIIIPGVTPTREELLEAWRTKKGLTREDMADIFVLMIREHLSNLEKDPARFATLVYPPWKRKDDSPDQKTDPDGTVYYSRAGYVNAILYLLYYPPHTLPQEEYMALVQRAIDLDPDLEDKYNTGRLIHGYIAAYPDCVFDERPILEMSEKAGQTSIGHRTILFDLCKQIEKEKDEARKAKLLAKAFESVFQDDNLAVFSHLDRALLDHYDRSYATMPERKVQLEKAFAREEEKRLEYGQKTNKRYRRAKYALEHFGEGGRAMKILRDLDTNPRSYSAVWAERRMRDDLLLDLQETIAEHRGLAVCAGAVLVLLLAAAAFLLIRRVKRKSSEQEKTSAQSTEK
jgi:hypothetical protein